MKITNAGKILGACALLIAAPAFSQSISVDHSTGAPGDTVTNTATYTAGGGVAGFSFDLMYNAADFDVDAVTTCGGGGGTGVCNATVDGNINVQVGSANELSSGTFLVVDFLIAGGANADNTERAFTIENLTCGDVDSNPVSCTVTDSGGITVASGPSLDAAPASDTINITVNGSNDATSTFTANGGSVDIDSCADTGGDSEISFAASPPGTLADGASFDVTATCSSAAEGTFNNAFSCTSDASNSPTTFDVTCTAGAGTANVTVNPPSGGQLTVGPLQPGGSGSGQVTFTETNDQGVGFEVTGCTISGTGAGSFSLGSTGTTVPAGGSSSITVNATAPADGTIPTATLDCTVDGSPYTITLGIFLQPLVVPTMTQWGLILMALGLFGFGFWTLRRRGDFTA